MELRALSLSFIPVSRPFTHARAAAGARPNVFRMEHVPAWISLCLTGPPSAMSDFVLSIATPVRE